ncbi:YfjI family protein [Fuchsiella alkaliacetigena]|uniref:YfjI family protein n=1 Tax=Fuchsiella alkaliacetigena TaxID=957042 RepID=UPI00200A7B9B|nr:YfjI family protein [Fuchsiella alkaliacetigena]
MEKFGSEKSHWPDPHPLDLKKYNKDINNLDSSILPNWLRDFTDNLAEATQTPVGLSIMLSLSVLSTALSKKAVIKVKQGWREPLNIWTCSVMPTGNRKSPVFNKMIQPIKQYEKKLRDKFKLEADESKIKKEIVKERFKKLKNQAINENDENKREKLLDEMKKLQQQKNEINAINIPTLYTDDITTEALAIAMKKNYGRLALLSPEGIVFRHASGLYSGNINLNNLKKSWTGDESINVNRVTRSEVRIDNPALTIGITVQPSVINNLNKDIFRREGLLGRFLFCYPNSWVGKRDPIFDTPNLYETINERYKKAIKILLNSKPKEKKNGDWIPHIITFDDDAKQILNDYSKEVETELREGGRLCAIRDWANKLIGNIIRVSGLMHLANQIQFNESNLNWSKLIDEKIALSAVKLGRRLINHTLKTFDLLDKAEDYDLAKYILDKITKGKAMESSGDLIDRFGKERLDKSILYKLTRKKKEITDPDALNRPLDLLTNLNYIKLIKESNQGKGRPPSPKIVVNPKYKRF